jgi:hypothetical protein
MAVRLHTPARMGEREKQARGGGAGVLWQSYGEAEVYEHQQRKS